MSVHASPRDFLGAVPQPDIDGLHRADRRDLLRFITCGSVDDGKSTLIGRLLYDTKQLFDDQLGAVRRASETGGTQGGALDLALALDGLAAEREQGITIDVAYRFFSTERRSFIVADTPGHEQYTRNMATGASTADAAILLVDARKGLTRQTRRHSLLVSTLGIRHAVVAVNKMDLVDWSEDVFAGVMAEYESFAAELGFQGVTGIPISALCGDNVAVRSEFAPWYGGPTLLEHLELIDVAGPIADGSFRLPVQWVNRPDLDFRGYAGMVSGGAIRVGDPVEVLPSGETSRVARIVTYDGDLGEAVPGQSVTITLADEVDASRGSLLVGGRRPALSDALDARLFWMAKTPLRPGDSYLAKLGTLTAPVVLRSVGGRVDLNTLASEPSDALEANDVGDVTIAFDRAVPFDPYARNRDTGSFILIDRESLDTVAMGLVLRESVAFPSREAVVHAPAAGSLPAGSEQGVLETAAGRALGAFVTGGLAFLLTTDVVVAASLAVLDVAAKLALRAGYRRLRAGTSSAPITSR